MCRQIYPAPPVSRCESGNTELVQDYTAMMPRALRQDDPAPGRLRKGFLGRFPPSRAHLKIEPALDHPSRARSQAGSALSEPQRSHLIACPQRLIEQPAKPEKLHFRLIEHRGEEFLGCHFVAFKLGGLGGQEEGQRRVGEQRIGPAGATLRLLGIARGNRDHPARQRAIAGAAPPLTASTEKCARAAGDQRYQPEQQRRRKGRQHHGGDKHTNRGLQLPALPDDSDLSRAIGEKDRDENQRRYDDEDENGADHDGVLAFSDAPSGAAGGDAGCAGGALPSRTVTSSWR